MSLCQSSLRILYNTEEDIKGKRIEPYKSYVKDVRIENKAIYIELSN